MEPIGQANALLKLLDFLKKPGAGDTGLSAGQVRADSCLRRVRRLHEVGRKTRRESCKVAEEEGQQPLLARALSRVLSTPRARNQRFVRLAHARTAARTDAFAERG